MNVRREILWYVQFLLTGSGTILLICSALDCLMAIRRKVGPRLLMGAGALVISFNVILVGDWWNLPVGTAFFLICIWFSCEGSARKKLTLGLIFASVITAFNGFFDNGVIRLIGERVDRYDYNLLYCGGRALFALILYLQVRFQRPERDAELSPPLWRLLLSLAVPALGIEMALIFFRSPFYRIEMVLADMVLFLVVVFSFRGLLRAFRVLERQQRLEQESMLAVINDRYYEGLKQQQFELRRLRHDLSNHLQVLLTLPEERKNSYIQEMLDNSAFVKSFSWCGDPTVNAVLAVKENMMRQKNIAFEVKVDIAAELPFDKVDICALLANGLDNGAQGCMELEPSLRRVRLEARADKGMLAVEICNPIPPGEGKRGFPEKGVLPKTTKKDVENHGYGLRSIQEAVRKYGGNMEIRRGEGSFVLFFYLFFPG